MIIVLVASDSFFGKVRSALRRAPLELDTKTVLSVAQKVMRGTNEDQEIVVAFKPDAVANAAEICAFLRNRGWRFVARTINDQPCDMGVFERNYQSRLEAFRYLDARPSNGRVSTCAQAS